MLVTVLEEIEGDGELANDDDAGRRARKTHFEGEFNGALVDLVRSEAEERDLGASVELGGWDFNLGGGHDGRRGR